MSEPQHQACQSRASVSLSTSQSEGEDWLSCLTEPRRQRASNYCCHVLVGKMGMIIPLKGVQNNHSHFSSEVVAQPVEPSQLSPGAWSSFCGCSLGVNFGDSERREHGLRG